MPLTQIFTCASSSDLTLLIIFRLVTQIALMTCAITQLCQLVAQGAQLALKIWLTGKTVLVAQVVVPPVPRTGKLFRSGISFVLLTQICQF